MDIIVQLNNTLVAVEVKTRSTDDFGDPQDFLKPKQKNLLIGAMDEYVEVRFDVMGIIKKTKKKPKRN